MNDGGQVRGRRKTSGTSFFAKKKQRKIDVVPVPSLNVNTVGVDGWLYGWIQRPFFKKMKYMEVLRNVIMVFCSSYYFRRGDVISQRPCEASRALFFIRAGL